MGSQTIEILRQGVWASLTGGWFYDPHQNVFCNIVHLYLWLFLLCSPFVTYLYFTETIVTWTIYCLSVGITIGIVKIVNHVLHGMYDEAQIVSANDLQKSSKSLKETTGNTEDAGIEMQILGAPGTSNQISQASVDNNNSMDRSQANSAMSIDCPDPMASTIDLKVDVHRKNSSESSGGDEVMKTAMRAMNVVTHSAEVCHADDYRRQMKTKSKSEEAQSSKMSPTSDDGDGVAARTEERRDLFDIESAGVRMDNKKRVRTKLQRQTSLDSNEMTYDYCSDKLSRRGAIKLHHHRSSDNNDARHRQYYGIYHPPSEMAFLEENFKTKSEMAIENCAGEGSSKMFALQKKTMRKDSNSTMSAIQLPTMSSSSSSARLRRHSNSTSKQLPSGIVSVRRIKSTALETCCPQPSVSNLSPHPNSVETIGGRPLRNPQHAVLPPPSKLVRNQHLNLYSKSATGSTRIGASSTASVSSVSDAVYPIAEQSDEKNINDSFVLNTESESDDEDSESDDDEKDEDDEVDEDDDSEQIRNDNIEESSKKSSESLARHRKSTTSESDNERRMTQSTDSDTENNGSQSPLLDGKLRAAIFSADENSEASQYKRTNKISNGIQSKLRNTFPVSPTVELDEEIGAVGGQELPANIPSNTKSEDSGCPSSDCEQASASSKDMLLSKECRLATDNDRKWSDLNVDSNVISVNVAEMGDNGNGDDEKENNGEKKKLSADEQRAMHESKGAIPKTRTSKKVDDAMPSTSKSALNDGEHQQKRQSMRRSFSSLSMQSNCDPMAIEMFRHLYDGLLDNDERTSSVDSNLGDRRTDDTLSRPTEDIFPSQRKQYLCLHPAVYRPMRTNRPTSSSSSSRHPHWNWNLDSRNDDSSAIVPVASTSNATGGSATVESGGGWDFLDIEVQDSINAFIIQELMEDQFKAFKKTSATDEALDATTPQANMAAQMSTFNRNATGAMALQSLSYFNYTHGKPKQPKRYFKFPLKCFGKREIKVSMDRLQLLALFDQDFTMIQMILGIILAALVSFLGAIILRLGFYRDLYAFIFCFVMAGSQFSLLKSVQPDASSPIHGFNKTVAYSRPIYFCLCASILILSYHLSSSSPPTTPDAIAEATIRLYGISFTSYDFFRSLRDFMSTVLLVMPLLFSFGLFPQVNTFLIYILEQVDMHMFGGNAVCSLLSAFLGVMRSMVGVCILYGFAFGGLAEPRSTQHVLFTCFCALCVAVSYHLSRSASDCTYLWMIIKSNFAMHPDEDEELKQTTKLSRKEIQKSQKKQIAQKSDDDKMTSISKSSLKVTSATETSTTTTAAATPAAAANKPDTNPSEPNDVENDEENADDESLGDPLPNKLKTTVNLRLKNDFLVCIVIAGLVFSLHSSTVFTVLQPELNPLLQTFAVVLGFLLHYVLPQMRKYLPWLCFAKPILQQNEFGMFEASDAAKIMWFERAFVCISFFERNILLPLVFLSALTSDSPIIVQKFGMTVGAFVVALCGLKSVRSSYSDPSSQFIILLFTMLFFRIDCTSASESFLLDYYLVSIIFKKMADLLLKLQFIVTYIAPWQITWGSAFHAFAQPFSVPHSAMLFMQAVISAVLSTPLNPFLGSAIFLTSYARPIKFWERDYNTRRIDHSNTRLSSQLERDLGADDNNLNSIFYEHLTRSLQHSLCGDLLMGRWGNVSQGDCFVLASDYLNCLVHIIELGNGLCTFQMRGLEFRGTYCQQREVEAISEGIEDNGGCCCCSPGHLPNMLSVNAMFSTRWLAWQVVASQYILEGYSISDNLAQTTLQVYEFRKVLITYYVKSIIYYTIRSSKLDEWLTSPTIQDALKSTLDRQFVDLDPIFNHNLDEDFDFRASGITRFSFCAVYMDWIQFCYQKRKQSDTQANKADESQSKQTNANASDETKLTANEHDENVSKGNSSTEFTPSPRVGKSTRSAAEKNVRNDADVNRTSPLISLLLALGLLARRTLATATHTHSTLSGVEFFLHGLHALFKGDFRITSPRDEWVFADMDLLRSVIAPAVKMSLKLHQDHFMSPEEYDDPDALYTAISTHTKDLVISHEADPVWRNAVLRGAPQLLALRHVMEDGSDEYRLIRLTKRFLSFRVIKLNRECVRGLWAGQQQELIYLRNRNPERGSIQNAKQALRNIINSSCDQPIGYPIYVSPLTTSYSETNEQLCQVIGGAITMEKLKILARRICQRVRQRCREGCSSGSATIDTEMGDLHGVYCNVQTPNNTLSGTTGTLSYGSQSLSGAGNRGSLASMGKPNSSTLLAGFLNREREQEHENGSERNSGVYRKRGSVMTKAERERRATFPVSSSSNADKNNVKCSSDTKQSEMSTGDEMFGRSNNSVSSSNLSSRDTRTLAISMERKSRSEERQPSQDHSESGTHRNGAKSESVLLTATTAHFSSPTPPKIRINRKVIIVDASEIYDCLDLGRRIDVAWPSEKMRLAGGRSSWKEWTPMEGMVGYVVHYWQPSHPNSHFRSNFNRTLFLIQIGDHFVPISENGIKEYNIIGVDRLNESIDRTNDDTEDNEHEKNEKNEEQEQIEIVKDEKEIETERSENSNERNADEDCNEVRNDSKECLTEATK